MVFPVDKKEILSGSIDHPLICTFSEKVYHAWHNVPSRSRTDARES
jgi:hypothetical protein